MKYLALPLDAEIDLKNNKSDYQWYPLHYLTIVCRGTSVENHCLNNLLYQNQQFYRIDSGCQKLPLQPKRRNGRARWDGYLRKSTSSENYPLATPPFHVSQNRRPFVHFTIHLIDFLAKSQTVFYTLKIVKQSSFLDTYVI